MITKLLVKIGKKLKGRSEEDVPGFVSVNQRESLLTWHRTDIALTDVYEIMETLGQGHMGEVYKVRRKQESRGLHNDSTRNKTTAAAEEESRRHRSKSPLSVRRRKRMEIARKNEETLNLYVKQNSDDKSTKSSGSKIRPILRKPSYGVLPSGCLLDGSTSGFDMALDEDEDAASSRTDASNSIRSSGTAEELSLSGLSLTGRESIVEEDLSLSGRGSIADELSISGRGSGLSERSDVSVSRTSGFSIESDDENDVGEGSRRIYSPNKRLIPKRVVRFQRLYACKTVLTTKVKKDQLDELMNEIYIMRQMDHPYIIRLYEVYQIKRKRTSFFQVQIVLLTTSSYFRCFTPWKR